MQESRSLRTQRAVQLAGTMWWVICGKGSHIDRHAGHEIALGIVRRIRSWWNLRRCDDCGSYCNFTIVVQIVAL